LERMWKKRYGCRGKKDRDPGPERTNMIQGERTWGPPVQSAFQGPQFSLLYFSSRPSTISSRKRQYPPRRNVYLKVLLSVCTVPGLPELFVTLFQSGGWVLCSSVQFITVRYSANVWLVYFPGRSGGRAGLSSVMCVIQVEHALAYFIHTTAIYLILLIDAGPLRRLRQIGKYQSLCPVVHSSLFSLAPARKLFYFPRTAFISHRQLFPEYDIAVIWTKLHND
jgi:hypothetical protein